MFTFFKKKISVDISNEIIFIVLSDTRILKSDNAHSIYKRNIRSMKIVPKRFSHDTRLMHGGEINAKNFHMCKF